MSHRAFPRAAQLGLVCLLLAVALGADDASARFDKDSREMMCVCGCNELLGECNHVGCPNSEAMRAQLAQSIAKGDSDNAIFRAFQQQYGPVVLASPRFTRFNHVAWILPPLVLLLGIGATMLIVRKWELHAVPMPAVRRTAGEDALRDRIRRETQL